jgi:hypothetical protein
MTIKMGIAVEEMEEQTVLDALLATSLKTAVPCPSSSSTIHPWRSPEGSQRRAAEMRLVR